MYFLGGHHGVYNLGAGRAQANMLGRRKKMCDTPEMLQELVIVIAVNLADLEPVLDAGATQPNDLVFD